MPFFRPENFCVGESYRLTEVIESREVSSGKYFLVQVGSIPKATFPALGFAKTKNSRVEIFLVEAHAQFGDHTWRRAFKRGELWEVYSPAGATTWNRSYVLVEKSDVRK